MTTIHRAAQLFIVDVHADQHFGALADLSVNRDDDETEESEQIAITVARGYGGLIWGFHPKAAVSIESARKMQQVTQGGRMVSIIHFSER